MAAAQTQSSVIYTPARPRPLLARGFIVEGQIILCLFVLAPAFIVQCWPVPAGALVLLSLLRFNLPPEPLILAGWLAALAALLGSQAAPDLAAGLVWWIVALLLTVSSLQTIQPDSAIYAILIAASLHAVYGPISAMGPRLAGYLGNPNVYGGLLAICLPLAVARRAKLPIALLSGGLILSGSVGAALAAGAGLAVLGLQNVRARDFLRQNWKPAGAAIVALVLVGTAGIILTGRGDTWYWRPLQWTLALHQATAHPLAGTGPGSTPALWAGLVGFSQAIPTGLVDQMIGYNYWPAYTHAHNLYLHVLAETGIIGALALAAVFVYVAYNVRGPALAGLAGLAVHGLVDATALHPVIAILAAMLIGIGSPRETHPARMGIILAGLLALLSPVAGGLIQALY